VTREIREGWDEGLKRMSVLGHGQGQGHGECHGTPESEVDSIWKEIAELIIKKNTLESHSVITFSNS